MKSRFWLLIFLFFAHMTFGQTANSLLKNAANDMANKIAKRGKRSIAVADFVNNAGATDKITNYLREQFEIDIINAEGNISILDRKHIKQLLSDNHLQSQGLIDETTAKNSVGFIKVDGWAFGEITTFGDKIQISIKVIDVTSSEIFAAYSSEPISDPYLKSMITSTEQQISKQQEIPLEQQDCYKRRTGDCSFGNNAIRKVKVILRSKVENGQYSRMEAYINKQIIIDVRQSQSFYNLPAGVYGYETYLAGDPNYYGADYLYFPMTIYSRGEIRIDPCKSQNITIR